MTATNLTIADVDRAWRQQTENVDCIQYQYQTGQIDQDEYYDLLTTSALAAETVQEIWNKQNQGT